MSKDRKATVIIDADVKPFERGLRDAEGLMKGFEQKAAKAGAPGGGGGGGLPGFLKPFAGMMTGGKALEAGVNAATIVFQAVEFAAAKATGDLDDMAQTALAVNRAQRDLVSGVPMIGAALSRLLAAMGREQEQRMTEAVAGQKAMAQELDGLRTSAAGLADELSLLKMALAGASSHTLEITKAQIDYERILQAERKKEISIQEKLNAAKEREATLAGLQSKWDEKNRAIANHYRNDGGMHTGGVVVKVGLTPSQTTELEAQRQIIADAELALIESKEKQADLIERQRVQSDLRVQKETQKARERIQGIDLQNALMRTGFIEDAHERELARIEIEERAALSALDKARAGQRERLAVKETFTIRRERVQADKVSDAAAGRRDLQRRLNAPDNAGTAAYVSMSGAVTNASVEQQQLTVMKQTQRDIAALVKLEQQKRHKEPTIHSRGFRRERLN